MSSENLDQGNLQSRNLSVKEDTRQIQLNLETNVDVCSVDSRTPPQRKPTVGNLIQTRPLGIGQFLELHALLETGRLLPKQSFPGWECSRLEQCVLQNGFNTPEGLDNICTICIQVPQLTIVALRRPPERI
jgi:hypothetical protein